MNMKCKCGEHLHEKQEGHMHLHRHELSCHHESVKFSISVYCHESAAVGTVKGSFEEYYCESVKLLEDIMRKAAAAITEQGGTIGHVKSCIQSSEDFCMLSITDIDDGVIQTDKKVQHTEFETAAIVFGITEKQLYEILTNSFDM